MNIAFTGTANHASLSTIMETKGSQKTIVSHKILCTLNDVGKKDAYNFENLLDEFQYTKGQEGKNKIMFEIVNEISEKDVKLLLGQDSKKIKEEYAPRCLSVKINGKPVNIFRNNLYIFKKLQTLADDIGAIRPIDLLFEKKTIAKKEFFANIFENFKISGKKREALAPCFRPENIKINSALASASLDELIRTVAGK